MGGNARKTTATSELKQMEVLKLIHLPFTEERNLQDKYILIIHRLLRHIFEISKKEPVQTVEHCCVLFKSLSVYRDQNGRLHLNILQFSPVSLYFPILYVLLLPPLKVILFNFHWFYYIILTKEPSRVKL